MNKIIKRGLPLVLAGGLVALVISSYKPKEPITDELGVPLSVSTGFGLLNGSEKYTEEINGEMVEKTRPVLNPYGALMIQYRNSEGKVRNFSTGIVKGDSAIYNVLLASAGLQQEIQDGDNQEVLFGLKDGKLNYLKFTPVSAFVDTLKF